MSKIIWKPIDAKPGDELRANAYDNGIGTLDLRMVVNECGGVQVEVVVYENDDAMPVRYLIPESYVSSMIQFLIFYQQCKIKNLPEMKLTDEGANALIDAYDRLAEHMRNL